MRVDTKESRTKLRSFIGEIDYQSEWERLRSEKELFGYTKAISEREEIT